MGSRYGDVGQAIPLTAYSSLDGALHYTVSEDGPTWLRKATIKLAFNNLLDSHKIYALAGYTASTARPIRCTGRCRVEACSPQ